MSVKPSPSISPRATPEPLRSARLEAIRSSEIWFLNFIPVLSDRTEVKELNYDRAKKIAIEATEQSNQLVPPEISKVIKLKEFLMNLDVSTKLLFADVNSKDYLKTEDLEGSKFLNILIGPEGDFSPMERELILSIKNVKPFSLSKNILKTETASISALTLINYFLKL